MKYVVEVKGNILLLFINGAGISKWMWKYQKPLSKKYKCVFFDLPGHGDNANIDFKSIDDICLFLVDLIKKESEDNKAIVIGLSIGAQIVLSLLKSYSEYISKAVVISALNNPMKAYDFFIKPMLAISTPLIHGSQLQFKQFSLPGEWFEVITKFFKYLKTLEGLKLTLRLLYLTYNININWRKKKE